VSHRELEKLLKQPSREILQVETILSGVYQACPALLGPQLSKNLMSGKRLRPILMILTAKAINHRPGKKLIKAAAAVELVHKASIFHDSIMDDRHSPTSRGISLLAGDYLLAQALQLAGKVSEPANTILTNSISEMVRGEASQLSRRRQSNDYIEIAKSKTGSLFSVSCALGAQLANATPAQTKKLQNYGLNFGIAFQIIDDILDKDIVNESLAAARLDIEKFIKAAERAISGLATSTAKQTLLALPSAYYKAAIS
jgi:geranylgeranyl pyrophosphate synthase